MVIIPPFYPERCERPGFDDKSIWLGEKHIQPQSGAPH
jgi:hypothetical protein